MKYYTSLLLAVVTMILTTVGCQSVPWKRTPPAEPPEMAAMRNQIQQYQARTNALEASNNQITIQLSQKEQELLKAKEYNKRGDEAYQALAQENIQLKKERRELIDQNNDQAQKLNMVAGALKTNGTTAIVPNSTVVPVLNFNDIPGAYARRDGQYYRVSVQADDIFDDSQTTLTEDGKQKVVSIAQRLASNFGQRQFRIEAHTTPIHEVSISDPTINTPQKLTVAQATAVSDAIIAANAIPEESLSITGCGTSQPMVSMSTAQGQAMNKRIEFVVLP
ncbi:MAG: OmpA family protein [Thermoguttaceae bacterium]|nr:OmpA family protein [Thermoguttaceae bacterium]